MSIDLVDYCYYVCPTLKESVIHQLISAETIKHRGVNGDPFTVMLLPSSASCAGKKRNELRDNCVDPCTLRAENFHTVIKSFFAPLIAVHRS